jgi:Ser-tRNA(Ala) deacylase AlaX
MTEKLYATDAYVKEFVATILKIDGNQIVLDRTAFYAENGGQVGDTGFLDQTRIVDTIYNDKNEKGYILHITDEESDFKQGDKVIGKIDWDRRYRIMRNHAASHIMEYFLFETFGRLKLIGTVVNEKHDSSTYKYNETFDRERLEQVEKFANLFISENFEIKRWEDDTKPGWWYWKAGNIMMPCGGTHPNNTKEIGKISIKRKSGGKGKEKILTSVLD